MTKRTRRTLPALVLILLCLYGCARQATPRPDPLTAYEGTWYSGKTAAACYFKDGKIYRDDVNGQDGPVLIGIFSDGGGHLEANLANTGGVHVVRHLYVITNQLGEVLIDNDDGTIYFYRDPLAAMEALESATPSDQPEISPDPIAVAPDEDVLGEDEDGDFIRGGIPAETEAPSAEPEPAGGDLVWIPKSGSRYHRIAGCSGMKDPRQITRAEAERKNLTPCKRCW